jgi:RNA polymerase sigma factor (sigma-70 family)
MRKNASVGGRDLNYIFGKRNWPDVYSSIMRNVSRRWPKMNSFDIEDSVSAAMGDLIDYWIELPSSVSDDAQRNFAYAVTRGTWKAHSHLGKRSNELESSISLEELEIIENSNDEIIVELAVEPFGSYVSERAPSNYSPSAEETMFDMMAHDEILNAINNLSDDDFNNWFLDFWSGDSLVEIAERTDVSPDTVRMRRNRGLNRLAEQAK